MLRFDIHPGRGRRVVFDAARAYLIGAHDHALKGKVRERANSFVCELATAKAAAVNLECETPEMGRLALSTCLLEQRDEPYPLMLELARHRIKQFIAKAEDWQIWDHPAAADALKGWNGAREHFTAAMTNADPEAAEAHASDALVAGIKANERLALAHAQILMHRRFGGRAASARVLGIRLDANTTPARIGKALHGFDMACLPLRWATLEPTRGAFDFSSLGPWIQWAQDSGRTLVAGPLIDLTPENLPSWMDRRRMSVDDLTKAVWDYAKAVGDAIAGHVRMWSIARGLNDGESWPMDLSQMVELARRAEIGLRAARKEVPTLLEIESPFGHAVAARPHAVVPRTLVDTLVNEGVRVDCLLLRLLMGDPGPGHLTRDMLEVSSLLDSYIPFRKPTFVELGVPSSPIHESAGHWRAPWSPKSQAVWASRAFTVAMSKPHVELVLWSALADPPAGASAFGLIANNGVAKPVVEALATAREALRKPLGPWKAPVPKASTETREHSSKKESRKG